MFFFYFSASLIHYNLFIKTVHGYCVWVTFDRIWSEHGDRFKSVECDVNVYVFLIRMFDLKLIYRRSLNDS